MEINTRDIMHVTKQHVERMKLGRKPKVYRKYPYTICDQNIYNMIRIESLALPYSTEGLVFQVQSLFLWSSFLWKSMTDL